MFVLCLGLIKPRLTLGSGFEASVYPHILLRAFAHSRFNKFIDARRVLLFIPLGKMLKRWINFHIVTAVVCASVVSKGNHLGFAQTCQLRSAGDGGGGDAEEGHKYMVLSAVVLIRREPDRASASQAPHHGAYVVAGNGKTALYMPLSTAALHPVVDGVFVGAVQTVDGVLHG